MPTYDYECDTCKTQFTLQHSFKYKPTQCSDVSESNPDIERILTGTRSDIECKGTLNKVFMTSRIGAKFTGTGFYQTDYKTK